MASVISPLDIPSARTDQVPGQVVRHRFTAEQYREMIARGIFAEDEPIELIQGEIVRKMPVGNAHAATVKILNRILSKWVPNDLLISVQDPVAMGDSEPEPDLAILSFCDDAYGSRRPLPADVKLLVEVADSSIIYDREVKGSLYAAAGILEYWIVNLNNSTVEVYRDPQADGRFATVSTNSIGQTIQPLVDPRLTVAVNDLFKS